MQTLKRIFQVKLKKEKYNYEILDLMKKNMRKHNSLNSVTKIERIINYFLKEF